MPQPLRWLPLVGGDACVACEGARGPARPYGDPIATRGQRRPVGARRLYGALGGAFARPLPSAAASWTMIRPWSRDDTGQARGFRTFAARARSSASTR